MTQAAMLAGTCWPQHHILVFVSIMLGCMFAIASTHLLLLLLQFLTQGCELCFCLAAVCCCLFSFLLRLGRQLSSLLLELSHGSFHTHGLSANLQPAGIVWRWTREIWCVTSLDKTVTCVKTYASKVCSTPHTMLLVPEQIPTALKTSATGKRVWLQRPPDIKSAKIIFRCGVYL